MIRIISLLAVACCCFATTGFNHKGSVFRANSQDSVIRIKVFNKGGLKYEEDYRLNKIIKCRIYSGDKLMYVSPITKNDLQPSIIRLKSGNSYLSRGSVDTLEIINTDIPIMNFGIEVVNSMISPVGERVYLIKPLDSRRPGADKVNIQVKVFQEISKIRRPVFVSDSLVLDIK